MPDIRNKLKQYRRVLKVAKKPSKEEFTTSGKICAIGISLIGFIGFAIFLIFILLGV